MKSPFFLKWFSFEKWRKFFIIRDLKINKEINFIFRDLIFSIYHVYFSITSRCNKKMIRN